VTYSYSGPGALTATRERGSILLVQYAYVGGDPVNFRDPSGLRCTSVNTGGSFTNGNEFIVKGVRYCSGGSVRRSSFPDSGLRNSLGTNAGWWGSCFGSSHAGFNPFGGAAVIPAAANGDAGQEGNESPCKSYTLLGKTFDNSWRLQFLDSLVLQARGGFGSGARLGIRWGIKSNINVLGTPVRASLSGELARDYGATWFGLGTEYIGVSKTDPGVTANAQVDFGPYTLSHGGTLAYDGESQRSGFLGINPKIQLLFGAEAEIGIDVDHIS